MTSFHPRGLQAARAQKFKSKRPRSNSDCFQEEDLRQGFQWSRGRASLLGQPHLT
ncbi:cyclin dependent kinase 15 [Homo sapiens]|uniref:Cyclin dependent kinase 15 n=1 Tax=Homo sapiens TaxID=9606 RepID=F8WDP7_HUMAN|nr:cyclin dependent kinase 15 [Homo sapiens]KAI4037654.1 cyclin dependent kinase 15 [Homo sapiens]